MRFLSTSHQSEILHFLIFITDWIEMDHTGGDAAVDNTDRTECCAIGRSRTGSRQRTRCTGCSPPYQVGRKLCSSDTGITSFMLQLRSGGENYFDNFFILTKILYLLKKPSQYTSQQCEKNSGTEWRFSISRG